MINTVNRQNDTDPQRFSRLTQRGRSFWLCFPVLRDIKCQQWKGRVCDCTEIIGEFLNDLSGLSLKR